MSDFAATQAGIRDLHERYADAVWRQDFAAFADCFAEDGEWRISGLLLKGRPQIGETIAAIMERLVRVMMVFRTPILELRGEEVFGRTYVEERRAWKSGDSDVTLGLYYERFVFDGERWRFRWRLFQLLYSGAPDMSGRFHAFADYGPPPGMPPLDAVPPPA